MIVFLIRNAGKYRLGRKIGGGSFGDISVDSFLVGLSKRASQVHTIDFWVLGPLGIFNR